MLVRPSRAQSSSQTERTAGETSSKYMKYMKYIELDPPRIGSPCSFHALQAQLDPDTLTPGDDCGVVTGAPPAHLAFELLHGTHHGPRGWAGTRVFIIGEIPGACEVVEHVRVGRSDRVPDGVEPWHSDGELSVESADQVDDVGVGVLHEGLVDVGLARTGIGTNGSSALSMAELWQHHATTSKMCPFRFPAPGRCQAV